MKNFKQLLIWQKGMDLVAGIYELSKYLPEEEKYSLTSQIRRASVSIPSNIAEGSSRKSQKDYSRFIEIALGSCYELETQILIIEKLNLIVNQSDKIQNLFNLIEEEQKMLMSSMNKLTL